MLINPARWSINPLISCLSPSLCTQSEWNARMTSIREQLTRVETKEFWEIIDRGRNFEYMPPKQKEQMAKFYALLA